VGERQTLTLNLDVVNTILLQIPYLLIKFNQENLKNKKKSIKISLEF
jgi:hypothetical protein